MGKQLKLAVLLVAIFAALLPNCSQVCAAATSSARCSMTQQGLLACMPSITGKGPVRPSARCCSALAKADLSCLCAYKNAPILAYLHIDPKRAMQLPAKCNLKLPRQCI